MCRRSLGLRSYQPRTNEIAVHSRDGVDADLLGTGFLTLAVQRTAAKILDLHLLEVIETSIRAAKEKRAIAVESRFEPLDLRLEERQDRHHLHDHTRPADEQ